jgi:tetratricopeptide (TPR) repeat protein
MSLEAFRPTVTRLLADQGYWPAWAATALREGRYSEVVELCKQHLSDEPELVSGRTLFAMALFHAGRSESAQDEFFQVLARDPENQIALKYLGDIAYAQGDEIAATAYYGRIQEIDPHTEGLTCAVEPKGMETTRTITLTRGDERTPDDFQSTLRQVPFVTETMGDLYLTQGHPRLAAAVFRTLQQQTTNPRLLEKLAKAEQKTREKDRKD